MDPKLIVGGAAVVGLGVAVYLAATASNEEQIPTVAEQPGWGPDEVNDIQGEESAYQASVIVNDSSLLNLSFGTYTPIQQAEETKTDLGFPAFPDLQVYTYVKPVEQDPAVQAYINQADAAEAPSFNQELKDTPWYMWLTPVTAGISLYNAANDYSDAVKQYNTMQANALNMKSQLSAAEYARVTDEGAINFQAWFKYEEGASLYTGNPFNWNDTVAFASYLQVNAPDQLDAFLRAWQDFGEADEAEYLSKLQAAKPEPPPKPSLAANASLAEKQAADAEYQKEKDEYQQASVQYKAMLDSAKNVELGFDEFGNIFQGAYGLDESEVNSDVKSYYGAWLGNQAGSTTVGNWFSNLIGNAWVSKQTPQGNDAPTYTLTDGSVVNIYSGIIEQSGSVFKAGDKAFTVTAQGEVEKPL